MLAPAFHYKILEDFVPGFNVQSDILLQKLMVQKHAFDIRPFFSNAVLDIVCGMQDIPAHLI
jgi:cytochrome P450